MSPASPWTALAAGTLALVVVTGCGGPRSPTVTTPVRAVPVGTPDRPPAPPADETSDAPAPAAPAPVEHVVAPGETLWRIAHEHGVDLDELARANGIADPTRIEAGRRLVIPGATRPPVASPTTAAAWLWPVPGGRILSAFGTNRHTHRHTGVDIDGSSGDPVLAARSGRVSFRGSMRGYGKTVILDHGDGIQTLYAHNSDVLVRTGDEVEAGAHIARVGRTGNARGDHVHFEVRVDGGPVDPMPYLRSSPGGPRS